MLHASCLYMARAMAMAIALINSNTKLRILVSVRCIAFTKNLQNWVNPFRLTFKHQNEMLESENNACTNCMNEKYIQLSKTESISVVGIIGTYGNHLFSHYYVIWKYFVVLPKKNIYSPIFDYLIHSFFLNCPFEITFKVSNFGQASEHLVLFVYKIFEFLWEFFLEHHFAKIL